MAATTLHDFAAGETDRGPFIPTNRSNNPKAGQWTNRMSHNMIADYKRFLMTDGEGIRCSLYVSGCPFHCVECYNKSIWDFQAGHEYNDALEAQIMDDYLLTNQLFKRPQLPFTQMSPAVQDALWRVQPSYLMASVDMVRAEHGSVDRYLTEALGIDQAARKRLAELYLAD